VLAAALLLLGGAEFLLNLSGVPRQLVGHGLHAGGAQVLGGGAEVADARFGSLSPVVGAVAAAAARAHATGRRTTGHAAGRVSWAVGLAGTLAKPGPPPVRALPRLESRPAPRAVAGLEATSRPWTGPAAGILAGTTRAKLLTVSGRRRAVTRPAFEAGLVRRLTGSGSCLRRVRRRRPGTRAPDRSAPVLPRLAGWGRRRRRRRPLGLARRARLGELPRRLRVLALGGGGRKTQRDRPDGSRDQQ
jgi:hypothetical protein